MNSNEKGSIKENQKKNNYFGIVIDKTTLMEAIVGVIVITATMLFIFYLAGVFK